MKAVAIAIALSVANVHAAEQDTATGLIIDDGWEEVRAHCGGCHSHALVTSQRADRDRWEELIRWMQETQNLWQFQPDVEDRILDYLAKNYPAKKALRRAPLPAELMPRQTT